MIISANAARCRGSVPEIVRDGVTGFIRETEDELVEAVSRIQEIDRCPMPLSDGCVAPRCTSGPSMVGLDSFSGRAPGASRLTRSRQCVRAAADDVRDSQELSSEPCRGEGDARTPPLSSGAG